MQTLSVMLVFLMILSAISTDVFASARYYQSENIAGSQKTYSCEGFEVKFLVNDAWGQYCNAMMYIRNTGNKVIDNWNLSFDFNAEITYIWNATISKHDGNRYTITNVGYNMDINPNESVCIGFSAQYTSFSYPDAFSMNLETSTLSVSDYSVVSNVIGDSKYSCNGNITITNTSSCKIEDWVLEFDFDADVYDFYTAEILSKTESKGYYHYVIKNRGNNATINVNDKVVIGYTAAGTGNTNLTGKLVTNVKLTDARNVAIEQTPVPTVSPDPAVTATPDPIATVTPAPTAIIEPVPTEIPSIDEEKIVNVTEENDEIGIIFYKKSFLDDIVEDDETGISYVKNQLLLSTYPSVSFDVIDELVRSEGFDIVGYIEKTGDYQLESKSILSMNELLNVSEYFKEYSFICSSSLNVAFEVSPCLGTNDAEYGSEDWNIEYPNGKNWGLEALNIPSAWDICSDNEIKVGIFDSCIDINHEDLRDNIAFVKNNDTKRLSSSTESYSYHGTHVSSIVGAKRNNEIGIAGVVNNPKLYFVGHDLISYENPFDNGSKGDFAYTTMLEEKIGFAILILKNTRVINYSYGYSDSLITEFATESRLELYT